MKLSKQQLSDILYTPVIRDELDRIASDARAELEEGTLEIEGYERVKTAMKGDFATDTNDVEKLKIWITENDIAGGLQLTVGELKDRFRKLSIENEQLKIRNVNLHHAKEVLISKQSEVDGERVQWTKFDPNDPKTFPPCGGFLGYVAGTVVRSGRHPGETDEYFANKFSIKNHLTHWRPLPKPPVETE